MIENKSFKNSCNSNVICQHIQAWLQLTSGHPQILRTCKAGDSRRLNFDIFLNSSWKTCQKCAWSQQASITARYLKCMLVIRDCIRFCGISLHSATNASLSPCKVLGCTRLAEYRTLKNVPCLFNQIYVQWFSRPVYMNDCIALQIGVSYVCTVGTGIIVNQNQFWTDSTRIWHHILIKNLIATPQCRQCFVFNNLQVSFFHWR